ncbi:MAG: hypothetical protein AB1384_12410 [Actinomycetota bacterium]
MFEEIKDKVHDIELADGTYKVEFTMNCLCELEELVGTVEAGELPPGYRSTRAMLWAGLREHHPEITLEEAGKLLPLPRMAEVNVKLSAALMDAFNPSDSLKKEQEGPDGENPTGP